MQVAKLLRVSEVAAQAGWSRKRMLQKLQHLERRTGESILVNVGSPKVPRWVVSLERIASVAPTMMMDETPALAERLEAAEEEIARLSAMTTKVVERLSAVGAPKMLAR